MCAHVCASASPSGVCADKPLPRPKNNVDTVRLGIVVRDAAKMAAVYAAIEGGVGRYVRVKNGFATDASNYGYRAILANLQLESGQTVEQVFGGAHRKTWEALGAAAAAAGDGMAAHETEAILDGLLATRGNWMDEENAAMPSAAVNIAAEVQLIYWPYLESGRKLSHLPYKVVRCEQASELARDASGKRQVGRQALAAAERACMSIVPMPAGWV